MGNTENMKTISKTLIAFILIICINNLIAQTITQTIKGRIVDKESQTPLPGATIVILNTEPLLGGITNENGCFVIKNVPIGRYNIKSVYLGYEPSIASEVLVGSGKEIVINFELSENLNNLNEVVIKSNKGETLNSMASVSARQLSVEEASRYAGGFDDPARLASSFAGVSSSLGNNGIVIRGNAPKGLLWRMEGIEISNPTHFANIQTIGAGAITALSSQMLANSDFYTGAFPAEYGNATSGVFDIKLKTGNNDKKENTVQIGLIGIDISSEGPFIKGKKASYIFNYRYSTLNLLSPILPKEMGKLKYQDLSFKMNFPTKSFGTFSLWGIGYLDYQAREALKDSMKWESDMDKQQFNIDLLMTAAGLNNRIILGEKTYLNTTIAITGTSLGMNQDSYMETMNILPTNKINYLTQKQTISSFINHKFNAKFTNKSGIIINKLQYNFNIQSIDNNDTELTTKVKEDGRSYQFQAYTQSKYNFTQNLNVVFGIHSQFFALNKHYSFEPRTSISWNLDARHTLSFSYGLHSQMEMLNFYLVQQNTQYGIIEPNKKLDFSKAHHFVLLYDFKINEFSHLKFEPYFQYLFNVPVIPYSYYSLQNMEDGLYFNDSLANKGKGQNIGLDITYERYINHGYYYLATASIFDSKYIGGDGIKRNTRFNRNYVFNVLGGKEWKIGKNKNNIFSINGKLCLMGGEWLNPLNIDATYDSKYIVEDVSNAFTERKKPAQVLSFSLSYRINKAKHASIWSFSYMNVLGYAEFSGYYFDKMSNSVKKEVDKLVMPSISYKLEF